MQKKQKKQMYIDKVAAVNRSVFDDRSDRRRSTSYFTVCALQYFRLIATVRISHTIFFLKKNWCSKNQIQIPIPTRTVLAGEHRYVENWSCQYVEKGKSFICGQIMISAQRGKYQIYTMWKRHDVFRTWKKIKRWGIFILQMGWERKYEIKKFRKWVLMVVPTWSPPQF